MAEVASNAIMASRIRNCNRRARRRLWTQFHMTFPPYKFKTTHHKKHKLRLLKYLRNLTASQAMELYICCMEKGYADRLSFFSEFKEIVFYLPNNRRPPISKLLIRSHPEVKQRWEKLKVML